MDEEVSVEVTVTVQPQANGEDKLKSTNLDLQKIYEQIIERAKDAKKNKEEAEEEAKPLLRFLIAVEAVEKIDDVTAKKEFKITLPKDVADLLHGELKLELTKPYVHTDGGPAVKAVRLTVKMQSAPDTSYTIEGEVYGNSQKEKKWRPWWRSSTSTNQGGEWEIPVPSGWPGKPNQDKLDPDNPASKCVIFLRDILNAETSKYICPWSKELLMEITKGSGKLVYTKAKKLNLDDDKLSFNLWGVPTIDHLVPQSIGGANHTNNLLTVSQRANFAKGNFFPPEPNSWLTRDSYIKACKKAANSPATFVNVMRKYINESYNPPS
jgi:hypothetical protein